MNWKVPGIPGSSTRRASLLTLGVVGGLLALAPQWRRALRDRQPATDIELHATPRPVPTLNFSDARGQPMTLSNFRGRVVLLNIWATWCTPCREEMPTLDRLQGLLGGPDFEVLALSIDQAGLVVVQPFFKSIGIKHLRPYLDTAGEAMSTLVATGVPLTLLIDREGNEIGRKLGPAAWDNPAMVEMIRGRIGDIVRVSTSTFHATEITEVEWGRDFHLTDHHGRPRSLQDFRGKAVMLFFGFTHCTDVCPSTMADLARVVSQLGADGVRVQALFVTVDPERDTAPVLAKYVTAFHPDFLGLRGDPSETTAIAKEFKFFHAAHAHDAHGDYAVDHGSAIYVYGPQGRRRLLMNGPRNVDAMAADVSMLLRP
ncbi:MAG: SCO family protein [Rubrivivax sp.]